MFFFEIVFWHWYSMRSYWRGWVAEGNTLVHFAKRVIPWPRHLGTRVFPLKGSKVFLGYTCWGLQYKSFHKAKNHHHRSERKIEWDERPPGYSPIRQGIPQSAGVFPTRPSSPHPPFPLPRQSHPGNPQPQLKQSLRNSLRMNIRMSPRMSLRLNSDSRLF